jgi:hypothetical protein
MRFRTMALSFVASMSSLGSAATAADDAGEDVPRAVIDGTTHNLGRVTRGTVISETFEIANAGASPLTIDSMQVSSPGVRAHVPQTIPPGSSAELVIDWDTADYAREAEVQAQLALNDPAMPSLVLTLDGFVVSPIDVAPFAAFNLSQVQGEASSQTVTVSNNTERVLDITGTERDGESFTLTVKPVSPGRTYEVTATALRDVQPGEYQESAWLLTNDPEQPKIRLEVNLVVKPARSAHVVDQASTG